MMIGLALALQVCLASAHGIAQRQVAAHNPPPPFSSEFLEKKRIAEEVVRQSKDLVLAGKYEEAEAILLPATERYAGVLYFGDIERELAEIAIRQGRFEDALKLIPRQGAEKSDGRRYARIAFLEAAVGDYAVSKAMWDDMGPIRYIKEGYQDDWPNVLAENGLKSAWLLLIVYLSHGGDHVGFDYYLGLASKHCEPTNTILNYFLGQQAYGKKMFADAERYFRTAMETTSSSETRQRNLQALNNAVYQRYLQGKGSGS